MLVGFLIALMLTAGACSGQVAPTAQPSPASMDQAELRPIVEDAVKAALAEAMPPPGDEISRQELKDMMAEVLVATPPAPPAPPAPTQEDLAELVSKSIAEMLVASPTPVTRAEMEQLIRAEIALLRAELVTTSALVTTKGRVPEYRTV